MRAHTRPYDTAKTHGVHYTPSELASFLASRVVANLPDSQAGVVLDPACGDGELLEAVVEEATPTQREHLSLIGIDRDPDAVAQASDRLDRLYVPSKSHAVDFLQLTAKEAVVQAGLFDSAPSSSIHIGAVDAIISNPPYVRTQVLGSDAAQKLATRYGLTGRVDLYHAFVAAMTEHLAEGGVLGLLCSNRFLTTQGGSSLRRLLLENYELLEIIDLGDTKLFSAAVLPAIVIARKKRGANQSHCRFTRIYEVRNTNGHEMRPHPSVIATLESGAEGLVVANDLVWEIERGTLNTGLDAKSSWSMTSESIATWLATIESHTEKTFGTIGPIRVGIKSNADKIFIRADWDTLPPEQQPEAGLIRPVITHHVAQRWAATPFEHERRVLYPHEVRDGRRRPVDLDTYPNAARYLEQHRQKLTSREYVIKANRQWYEIWVAQDPSAWAKPKLVFPDISESPKFALDTSGAVVNGDCYWMPLDDLQDPRDISVLLAVANSTLAEKFYDAVCGNKLYAGRRRYITQYVEQFPIPRLSSDQKDHIHDLVEKLRHLPPNASQVSELESQLDMLVWSAFGFPEEVGR